MIDAGETESLVSVEEPKKGGRRLPIMNIPANCGFHLLHIVPMMVMYTRCSASIGHLLEVSRRPCPKLVTVANRFDVTSPFGTIRIRLMKTTQHPGCEVSKQGANDSSIHA